MTNQEIYRDRLHIAKDDLYQAQCFSDLILERDSFEETQDKESRLILQALDIALIVAYCRPFTGFNDRKGNQEQKIPRRLLAVLTEEELKLHDQLLGRRHKEYAHSDASQLDLNYFPSSLGILVSSRNRFVPLPEPKVRQVRAMSGKLYLSFDKELQGLEAQVG